MNDLQQEAGESFCWINHLISASSPFSHVSTPRAASKFEHRDVHTLQGYFKLQVCGLICFDKRCVKCVTILRALFV